MQNCPFNKDCLRFECDLACKNYIQLNHWLDRSNVSISNSVFSASPEEISAANQIIVSSLQDKHNILSNYTHLSVCKVSRTQFTADLISYVASTRYCRNIGVYHGVYKLNYFQYLNDIKASWNSRSVNPNLEDIQIWIKSAKYLVIYNLELVKFGDFEAQTLLSIFQERASEDNYSIVVLPKSSISLLGKHDSVFYKKLKDEIESRGVKV